MGGVTQSARAVARAVRGAAAPKPAAPALDATRHGLRVRIAERLGGAPLQDAIAGRVALETSDLRRLAFTDALTGIANRRSGLQALDDSVRREPRTTVAMFDVDDFKQVNDRLGHDVGDDALRVVARALDEVAGRHAGTAMRLGGEEFALLLPGRDATAGARIAAEALAAIRGAVLQTPSGERLPLSASAGVATLRGPAQPSARAGGLLAQADRGLYEAKRSGKDRVVVAGAP